MNSISIKDLKLMDEDSVIREFRKIHENTFEYRKIELNNSRDSKLEIKYLKHPLVFREIVYDTIILLNY